MRVGSRLRGSLSPKRLPAKSRGTFKGTLLMASKLL